MKTFLVLLALLALAFAADPSPTSTPVVAASPSAASTPAAASPSAAATPAAASPSAASTPAAASPSAAATPAAASPSAASTPAAASPSAASTPAAAASPSAASTPAAAASPSAASTPAAAASPSAASTPVVVASPSAASTPAAAASPSPAAASPSPAAASPSPAAATPSPLPSGASPAATPSSSPAATTTPLPARIRGVNNNPAYDDDVYFCISTDTFSTKTTGAQYELDDDYTELNGTAMYTIFVANNSDCDYASHGVTQNITKQIDGSFFISYSNNTASPIFITPEGFDSLTITNTTNQVFVAIQNLPETYNTVGVTFAPMTDDVEAKGFTFHFSRSVMADSFNVNVLTGQTKGGVANGEYNITFTFDATHSQSVQLTFDGNQYVSLAANYDFSVVDTAENFGTKQSSSSSDWLLWLVIGVAAIIVLVVIAVGAVIVFRHFKNKNQYDVIGDTSDGADDYKFQ